VEIVYHSDSSRKGPIYLIKSRHCGPHLAVRAQRDRRRPACGEHDEAMCLDAYREAQHVVTERQ